MFIHFDRIHKRDRHTHGHDGRTLHDNIGRACIAERGKNCDIEFYQHGNTHTSLSLLANHYVSNVRLPRHLFYICQSGGCIVAKRHIPAGRADYSEDTRSGSLSGRCYLVEYGRDWSLVSSRHFSCC